MDLFKDIEKGKKFTKKGLKKEARHELKELGGKKRAEALEKAIEKKKGGHKQNERESTAKKIGYYPHGHKNYGDVYEK